MPPAVWMWLQHLDLTEPEESVELRDSLGRMATKREHGASFTPGANVYALSIGPDIVTEGVSWWFHAMPNRDKDGVIRYWVESCRGRKAIRGSRTLDSGEVVSAFDKFLDALPPAYP